MTCTPPWSRYKTWNSLVSSGASSTKSVAARRVSKVFPVTRFRNRTWTNARRLPGVRWVKSITRHGCPSIMITCPRRMSVAFIRTLSRRGGKISRMGAESTGRQRLPQRQWLRQVPNPLTLPPRAARGPLGRRAEAVPVVHEPHVARRRARKRVLAQQRENFGCPFEQAPEQRHQPVPRALGVERREPHLPIQPRHVWRHERRVAGRIAGLPAKPILAPAHRVGAALDHNLEALRGHHAEQSVPVHRPQRRDRVEQRVAKAPPPRVPGSVCTIS